VSAQIKDEIINRIIIVSEFGERLHLFSPWDKVYLDGKKIPFDERGIIHLNTKKGKVYNFSQKLGDSIGD
jgi:hypothetical protein